MDQVHEYVFRPAAFRKSEAGQVAPLSISGRCRTCAPRAARYSSSTARSSRPTAPRPGSMPAASSICRWSSAPIPVGRPPRATSSSPPGRSTRRASATAACQSGIRCSTWQQITAPADWPAMGSCSADPRNAMTGDFLLASTASIGADRSTPTTRNPAWASGTAIRPVPTPTSSSGAPVPASAPASSRVCASAVEGGSPRVRS